MAAEDAGWYPGVDVPLLGPLTAGYSPLTTAGRCGALVPFSRDLDDVYPLSSECSTSGGILISPGCSADLGILALWAPHLALSWQ